MKLKMPYFHIGNINYKTKILKHYCHVLLPKVNEKYLFKNNSSAGCREGLMGMVLPLQSWRCGMDSHYPNK